MSSSKTQRATNIFSNTLPLCAHWGAEFFEGGVFRTLMPPNVPTTEMSTQQEEGEAMTGTLPYSRLPPALEQTINNVENVLLITAVASHGERGRYLV